MTDDTMDAARAAQIERNIDLAFQFAKELVEDPTRLAELPAEATVFIAPPDDPGFSEEQLGRAMRAAKTNKQVYLWRLGAPTGERAAFLTRVFTPRWPTHGVDPAAVYDRVSDTLVVDFFRGRRHGIPIPSEVFGLLFVDEQTEEVVGNILPEFLSRVVRRDVALIDVLLRPETELHGITRQEVGKIRDALRRDVAAPAAPPASFATLVERMEHLEPLTA